MSSLREPMFVSRVGCDKAGCKARTPPMISQCEAERIARDLGWRVGLAGDEPLYDYCPAHKDLPPPRVQPVTPYRVGEDPNAF